MEIFGRPGWGNGKSNLVLINCKSLDCDNARRTCLEAGRRRVYFMCKTRYTRNEQQARKRRSDVYGKPERKSSDNGPSNDLSALKLKVNPLPGRRGVRLSVGREARTQQRFDHIRDMYRLGERRSSGIFSSISCLSRSGAAFSPSEIPVMQHAKVA